MVVTSFAVLAINAVVVEAAVVLLVVIAVLVVVTKSAVCAKAVSNILPEVLEINARAAVVTDVFTCIMVVVGDDILDGVGIVVVGALEFAAPALYSVYLLSGVVAYVLIDVLTMVTIGIGVDALPDVDVNAFTAAMTASEFTVPGPLEEFPC